MFFSHPMYGSQLSWLCLRLIWIDLGLFPRRQTSFAVLRRNRFESQLICGTLDLSSEKLSQDLEGDWRQVLAVMSSLGGEKLRLLCLHGHRQSGQLFRGKLGGFRKLVRWQIKSQCWTIGACYMLHVKPYRWEKLQIWTLWPRHTRYLEEKTMTLHGEQN